MYKNISKLQIYLSAALAIILILQAYSAWGEGRSVLSIFYLCLSMINLTLIIFVIIGYKKKKSKTGIK